MSTCLRVFSAPGVIAAVRCCAYVPQEMVLQMVPAGTAPSAATARACVPYWLESTGWLAVLMSDATAAAIVRLPFTRRPDAPHSMPSSSVSSYKGKACCLH